METYCFYDATGTILRMQTYSFAADSALVAANTRSGESALLVPAGHAALSDPQGWSVVNGVLTAVVPTPVQLLLAAQAAQLTLLTVAYGNAVAAPVSYLGASFLDDPLHQQLLARAVQAYNVAGAVPSGFFVPDVNDNPVAMTLTELNGLAAAVAAQEWSAFTKLATLRHQVGAATTVAEVQAVVWP